MAITAEEKVEKKASKKPEESAVLASLWTQVVKPSDVVKVAAINVYGNRWRVNVWTAVPHQFMPNMCRISSSYFVSADADGGVTIL